MRYFLLFLTILYSVSNAGNILAEPSDHKTGWSYPLDDKLSGGIKRKPIELATFGFMSYNNQKYPYHYAQDFALNYNTGDSVYAMADGRIIRARKSTGYGGGEPCNSDYNTVLIEYNYIDSDNKKGKVYVFYGHVKNIYGIPANSTGNELELDIFIRKGQKIGELNDPSCSGWTAKHLHLSVTVDSFPSDYYSGYNSTQDKNGRSRPFDLWNNTNGTWSKDWVDSSGVQDSSKKDIAFFDSNKPVLLSVKQSPIWDWQYINFSIDGSYFGQSTGQVHISYLSSDINNVLNVESWSDDKITGRIKRSSFLSIDDDSFEFIISNSLNEYYNSIYYPFRDVKPSWYSKQVVNLWKHKIIKTSEYEKFYPENEANYAEFLKMLVISSSNLKEVPCSNYDRPFPASDSELFKFPIYSNTKGPWYCQYYNNTEIKNLIELLRSVNDNNIGWPGQKIKRKEIAFLIAKTKGITSSQEKEINGLSSFNDVSEENAYYPYIVFCADNNLITGFDDGTFKPEKNITRSELSVIIDKIFNDK